MNIKKTKLIFNLTLAIFTLALPLSKISAMEKPEKKLNEILDNEETKYCEESSENTLNDKIDSQNYKNQNEEEEYEKTLNEILNNEETIHCEESSENNSNDRIDSQNYRNKIEEYENSLNEIIKSIEDIFNNQNKITEDDKKTLDKLIEESENTLNNLDTKINEWYKQICEQEVYDSSKEECDKYLEDYKEYQKKLKLYKFRIKEYEIEKYKNYLNNIESNIKERLNSKNILNNNQPSLNTLLKNYGETLLKLKTTIKEKELNDYIKECNNSMNFYDDYYDDPEIIDKDICVEILNKYKDYNEYIENCNTNFKNYNNDIKEKYEQILNNNTNEISEENKTKLKQEYENILSTLDENSKKIFDKIINSIETILIKKPNEITKDDEKTLDELIEEYNETLSNLEEKITKEDDKKTIKIYKENIEKYKIKIKKNYMNILDETIILIETILNKETNKITKNDEKTLDELIEEYNETLSKLEEKITEEDDKKTIAIYKENLEKYKIKIKENYINILDKTIILIETILNKKTNEITKDYEKTLDKLIKEYEKKLSELEKKITKENDKETITRYKENLEKINKKIKEKENEQIFYETTKLIEKILNNATNGIQQADKITLDNLIKKCEEILSKLEKNTTENNKETIEIFKDNLKDYKNKNNEIKILPHEKILEDIIIFNYSIAEEKKIDKITEEDLDNLVISTRIFNDTFKDLQKSIICKQSEKNIIHSKENLEKYENIIEKIYIKTLDDIIAKNFKIIKNTNLYNITEEDLNNLIKSTNNFKNTLNKFKATLNILNSPEIINKNKENIKNYEKNLTKYKNKIINKCKQILNNIKNTITSEKDRKTFNKLIIILYKLNINNNKNYKENLINLQNALLLEDNQINLHNQESDETLNKLLKILSELNENTTKNHEEILNEKYEQTFSELTKKYEEKFTEQNKNIYKINEKIFNKKLSPESEEITSNITKYENSLLNDTNSINKIFEKNKIISEEDLRNLDELIKKYETKLTWLKIIASKNEEKTIKKYENIIKEFKNKIKKDKYKKYFNRIEKNINTVLNNSSKKSEPAAYINQQNFYDTLYDISDQLIEKYEITLNTLKKDTDVNNKETVDFYEQNLKELKKSTTIKLLNMIINQIYDILKDNSDEPLQKKIKILDSLLKEYKEIFTREILYKLSENDNITKRYKIYLTSMKKQIYTRKLEIKIKDLNKFKQYYENTIKNIKNFKSDFESDDLEKWINETEQFEYFISILEENADQTDTDFINKCNDILEDNKNKIAEIEEIKKHYSKKSH